MSFLTNKNGEFHFQFRFGKKWILIFYHNVYNESTFSFDSPEQVLECNTPSKYSILDKASHFPKIANTYEFLLEYPEFEQPNFNRWVQDSFPTQISNADVSSIPGFKCLDCAYETNFGGLLKNDNVKSYSYIEGCPAIGEWYFAIGLFQAWEYSLTLEITKQLPGPWKVRANEVSLYMRIPDNFLYQTCAIRLKISNLFHALLFLCLTYGKD